MTAVLISATLPLDPAREVHGIFKRLDLIVAGIRRDNSALDVIYLAPPHAMVEAALKTQLETNLSDRWRLDVTIHLSAVDVSSVQHGFWSYYLAPMIWPSHFETLSPFATSVLAASVRALLDTLTPTLVVLHRLQAAMPCLKATFQPQATRVIVDFDDVEHLAFIRAERRTAARPGRYLRFLQAIALIRAERWAAAYADAVMVCSVEDIQQLKRIGINNGVCVHNAVVMPDPTPLPGNQTLLFVGYLGYAPNREGIEYFLERIWPLVLLESPTATLRIVGARSATVEQAKAPPPGVTFVGFVDELATEYAQAQVVICPILSGSGTRLKIIEACAAGRPVVSTRLGAEGLPGNVSGAPQIAEDARDFARYCSALLANPRYCVELGAAARAYAREYFEFDRVATQLSDLFSSAT